jgi:hypothetical protein
MSKRDQEREITRRALIKWSFAAGAALGLSRAGVLEVLERSADRGVAEAAGDTSMKRSVHIRAGDGGLAWFQLLWPHNDIAAAAGQGNNQIAYHRPGMSQLAPDTDYPLTIGPDSPFTNLGPGRQITAFMAGTNETHTRDPVSVARSLNGTSVFALAAVLQKANPSVVPVIAIGDSKLGNAPDAPQVTVVPTGAGIVELFNSAASQAGGLLETTPYADLYRAQFATLAGLNRAAGRSTTKLAYGTARTAARFLGVNLASRLQIQPADRVRYGIDATGTNPLVKELGETLIVTAKAFELGLTSSVILPAMRDDPHFAFTTPTALIATQNTTQGLKKVLDGFMADLASRRDSLTGRLLSEEIVLTIDGDTPKTPLDKNAWPDTTPGNSNWVYVLGGGKLKTGWFGGIDRTAKVTGFDPETGKPTNVYNGNRQAQAACAAVAYAIARGDMSKVHPFSRVEIDGIVR